MKILVGLDDTKIADEVLKVAHKHAKEFQAEVYIMASLKQGPDLEKLDIDKAENKLERMAKPFKVDGISCHIHAAVSVKSPGEDLVRLYFIWMQGLTTL